MAKKESTLFSMVLTLLIVTLASAFSLGYIYEMTKDPISVAEAQKKNLALNRVLPEFDNSPVDNSFKVFADGDSLSFYKAMKEDSLVGIAVETFTTQGFGGLIKLMVGFLPDGSIKSIAVLYHKETPGLGDKMGQPFFYEQFENKIPGDLILKVKKDGGDIDAITASTITSRAYCDAVQRAFDQFMKERSKK